MFDVKIMLFDLIEHCVIWFQADSSQQSDAHKTPSETSEGPTPCKQARKHKKHVHHDVADAGSSDGKRNSQYQVWSVQISVQSMFRTQLTVCI